MVLIPAGKFIMGSDKFHQEGPAHEVYVDAFYIDTYEVTNAHFCAFLNEQGNQTEAGVPWLDLKDSRIVQDGGRFTPLPGYEDHPVVRVTWYGAAAYARWRNARLPSEAEWKKPYGVASMAGPISGGRTSMRCIPITVRMWKAPHRWEATCPTDTVSTT